MTPDAMTAEMDALLAHSTWVQDLARRLVRDPNVAEDLAQEAMLAAIRDGGRRHHSVKAWLGTVVRNLVWERVRREDRRGAREQDAARDEELPATGRLVERMTAHKQVVEVLMTLPEHYREVLLRRYFEGESPGTIAGALEVPQSTVRTRLSRAMAMMRERLDRESGGDGHTWVAGLAPLLVPRDVARTAAAPAVPTGFLVGAALLLVAVGLGALAWQRGGLDDVAVPEPQLAPVSAVAPIETTGRSPEPRRDPAPPAARLDPSAVATARRGQAPAFAAVRGRVVDLAGEPVSSVLVRFESVARGWKDADREEGDPIAIAGVDGSFELPTSRSRGWVVAERDDVATVFAGTPTSQGERSGLLVVTAPRLRLAGEVLDGVGRPVDGALVAVRVPSPTELGLALPLDAAAPVPTEALTDANGRFELERVPDLAGGALIVLHEAFEPLEVPLPDHDDLSLVLRLGGDAPGLRLFGEVVDAAGRPVAGARVSDGERRAVTDASGLFELPVPGDRAPQRLVAVADGHGSAVARADDSLVAGEAGVTGWPDRVVLRLAEASGRVTGRVVDGQGRGLVGLRVWVDDPTVFWAPLPRETKDEDVTTRLGVVPLGVRALPEVVEGEPANEDSAWSTVATDRDGAFVLEGLRADRAYRIGFLDRGTLGHMRANDVRAGDELEVRWAPGATMDVAGRVVDPRGQPLAGLDVRPVLQAFTLRREDVHVYGEQLLGRRATTNDEGAFTLADVPVDAWLGVEGAGRPMVLFGRDVGLAGLGDAGALELEVSVLTRLVVAIDAPADSVELLDDDDVPVELRVVQGPVDRRVERARLTNGRSAVLSVPLEASRIVVRNGEEVVLEESLVLAPGRVNSFER